MSETVSRPWILSYLLNIAQTVGTDLTRLKWEKGGRRAQLIDVRRLAVRSKTDTLILTPVHNLSTRRPYRGRDLGSIIRQDLPHPRQVHRQVYCRI